MTLVKAGATAGAVLALVGLFVAVVPTDLYVATRGWAHDAFGASVEMTQKMYVTDLRKSISHYNKQICYDTHTEADLDELDKSYAEYYKETKSSHPFLQQSLADICKKLRVRPRK